MAERLSSCRHHAMTLLQGPTTALLPTTRSSSNLRRPTGVGPSLPMSEDGQVAHEICHVLSGYERMRGSRNSWFHEVLCELASVFTLRRMAQGWPSSPPYPNWATYAAELSTYADKYLSREERRLPTTTTLSAWLLSEEDSLRQDCCQRDKNAVVAYTLLPIFESEPAGWNAIHRLPDSSAMFRDYLLDWHRLVEPADKPFVALVQRAFQ